MPKRIQLKRTKGWRMPEGAVKVDRTTKWGNPWSPKNSTVIGVGEKNQGQTFQYRPFTPDECIKAYRESVESREFGYGVADVRNELRGKNLACWCKPGYPCHADVLLELANGVTAPTDQAASPPRPASDGQSQTTSPEAGPEASA